MRLRVKPVGFAIFLSILVVTGSFSGLAGFFSVFIAIILPVLCIISLFHIWYSWAFFAFHQSFSTDHPVKGETVKYSLHLANEGAFPLSNGYCAFSTIGSEKKHLNQIQLPLFRSKSVFYEEKIRCAYRGTYVMGLTGISITSTLGFIETEISIEQRIFYVYPELVKFSAPLERLARSSGITEPDEQSTKDDITIFEYVAYLTEETPARSIAWKRWAATGIPCKIIKGRSRSSTVRIFLDLWPGEDSLPEIEKLASEDIAMTAVFSIMQYMASKSIPVSFFLGSADTFITIDSLEMFQQVFDQSTSIFFSDPSFPHTAFTQGEAALLITTRSLEQFFSSYEDTLQGGYEPHLFSCPPPSLYPQEKLLFDALTERRQTLGSHSFLRIIDTKNGTAEVLHAFSY